MRVLGLVACLITLGCCVHKRAESTSQEPALKDGQGNDNGGTKDGGAMIASDDAGAPEIQLPKLLVEVAPKYVIGFPVVIAVTYDNRSNPEDVGMLPDLNLIDVPWGIGFHLAPLSGGAPIDLEATELDLQLETEIHGSVLAVQVGRGEQRRMLLDLSNFGVSLPPESNFGPSTLQPGTYRFTLTLREAVNETTTSTPVTVELVSPLPEDAKEAARLRHLGNSGFDTGAWSRFLSSNWNTVVPSPTLSFDSQRQLALHLFLHRAFYGPEPVAKLDDALLGRITEPSLAADVATFRYEIVAARGAPHAKHMLDDLLARWPGMHYRFVPRYDRLGGRIPLALARGRQLFGPEGPLLPSPLHIPYTK